MAAAVLVIELWRQPLDTDETWDFSMYSGG
jgi:hypothetical protein